MRKFYNDEYVLIAKHCPNCEALVSAKMIKTSKGIEMITERVCFSCGWVSPLNGK
jgi:hypothetical protein